MLFVIKYRNSGDYYKAGDPFPVILIDDATLFDAEFDLDAPGYIRVTPKPPFDETWRSPTDPLSTHHQIVPIKVLPIQGLK